MRKESTVTVHRTAYQPPVFLVDKLALEFDLDPVRTVVTATLHLRRNPAGPGGDLVLEGEELDLLEIELDGVSAFAHCARDERQLILPGCPEVGVLRIRTAVSPQTNTRLMGLYVSNGSFFTQCEAEGFRRITYFPDRPDVMSVYEVELRADRESCPVLLSNGNLVAATELPDGRHSARWHDPFPKPSYLFALVAGRFDCRDAVVRTRSGRTALLQVWVPPGARAQAAHALDSLQRVLRWDEQRFGLELDLERFMIVASHDFNMGAMENKGLNVFNAKFVLADPHLATDRDYAAIESVIAHEYLHNWTGNRVTCRDWFQLSLKEGLTVFRDQEFSADRLGSGSGSGSGSGLSNSMARAVKRIEDVRRLRAVQFPEDAGPMAHPVRPDAYQEIGNFYTPTIYEKGAEVVRMLHTLLGERGFRRGMDWYIQRHDGQAVTCEAFLTALADANGRDLTQFARWYAQAGTPQVDATLRYHESAQCCELTLTQTTAPTPGQPHKEPLHIPVAVALLDAQGKRLPLQLDGEAGPVGTERVLELTAARQTFRFVRVTAAPVPSLLRNFSAPVVCDYTYSDAELVFLAAHDDDGFNRWEAGQRLALARLLGLTDAGEHGPLPRLDDVLVRVFRRTLLDTRLPPAFKELALQLPSESLLADARVQVDPLALRVARRHALRELGQRLAEEWRTLYDELASTAPYTPEPASASRRALRNLALAYLVDSGDPDALELARVQILHAANMTDQMAALAAAVNSPAGYKVEMLLLLAREWAHEPLLMNKWFNVQATAVAQPGEPPVLERVTALLNHPAFSLANPNNVYALILGFCAGNPAEFHRADGSGYRFWLEQVQRLDRLNPMVAARLARTLERWRRYTPERQQLMRAALEELSATDPLSRDVREIVDKALAG
jgi:aminopeptidase N